VQLVRLASIVIRANSPSREAAAAEWRAAHGGQRVAAGPIVAALIQIIRPWAYRPLICERKTSRSNRRVHQSNDISRHAIDGGVPTTLTFP
jgi:hypothetical protein